MISEFLSALCVLSGKNFVLFNIELKTLNVT